MSEIRCHDCAVEEGKLHVLGCDMERCPNCEGQLISCGCYKNAEDIEQNAPFRIPFVHVPVLCALCGKDRPLFKVSDEEWEKYVIPSLQKEHLCRPCYERMVELFPNGWMEAKVEDVL